MENSNNQDVTSRNPPSTLFKYLHPDRIDVLEACKICFASPLNLNDPFELKPPIRLYETEETMWATLDLLLPKMVEETFAGLPPAARALITKEQIESRARSQMLSKNGGIVSILRDLTPALHSRFKEEMEKKVGILCLTETPDDLLMWAHYACSHEGFVIEFDTESAFFNQRRSQKDDFRHLKPVQYSTVRPPLTFDNGNITAMLTKSEHWSYEREWRMMVDLSDSTNTLSFHGKTYHLFEFPPSCITSVILGARMPEAIRAGFLELIKETPTLSHIICYQASTDDTLFKLNIDPT
ncbi:DUF2971 domain-containing protein [Pseudomonas sp. Irchel s3h9]|uniref:DUF2971 domain-containing protein n=1 Tax=Pseudomonas sp. Irchel s3h9 TaxID=2009192 RepID=UPI0015B2A99E|nr:DUF2971 domain-containing protein [Pseudomonas sp. Irchel s3h9]